MPTSFRHRGRADPCHSLRQRPLCSVRYLMPLTRTPWSRRPGPREAAGLTRRTRRPDPADPQALASESRTPNRAEPLARGPGSRWPTRWKAFSRLPWSPLLMKAPARSCANVTRGASAPASGDVVAVTSITRLPLRVATPGSPLPSSCAGHGCAGSSSIAATTLVVHSRRRLNLFTADPSAHWFLPLVPHTATRPTALLRKPPRPRSHQDHRPAARGRPVRRRFRCPRVTRSTAWLVISRCSSRAAPCGPARFRTVSVPG